LKNKTALGRAAVRNSAMFEHFFSQMWILIILLMNKKTRRCRSEGMMGRCLVPSETNWRTLLFRQWIITRIFASMCSLSVLEISEQSTSDSEVTHEIWNPQFRSRTIKSLSHWCHGHRRELSVCLYVPLRWFENSEMRRNCDGHQLRTQRFPFETSNIIYNM
jgi:hypothetical protein